MTGPTQAWAGGLASGAALVALTGYLASVGLDDASKWAGVLGLFVSVAGVAVSVAGMRRDGARPVARPVAQAVWDSRISGGVTQVSGGGDVRITHRGPAAAPSMPPQAPAAPGPSAPPPDGQTVSGSEVAGPVDQVRDADGNVEIDRGP